MGDNRTDTAGAAGGPDAGVMELWTAQAPIVLETVARDGTSVVKKAYIDQKYGDAAWSFRTAYREFGRLMERRIPKAPGAESPIWLFGSTQYLYAGPGSHVIQLRVPVDQFLAFDMRNWNRVLNLEYLGTEAEERAFQRELERQGVRSSAEVFEKPFYPILKRRVTDSWSRLFEGEVDAQYLQAAVWEIRREWILTVDGKFAFG